MARLEESFSSLKNKENCGNNRLVAANALKTLSSRLNLCSTDDCDSKSDVETQKDEQIVSDKDSNFSRTFPEKLMEIISDEKNSNCISWLPDGHAFSISDRKKLSKDVIPRYFKGSSKYTSFTRKLNRWGFTCFTRGVGICIFHHKMFHRDFPHLCMKMVCKKSSKIMRCKDIIKNSSIENKCSAPAQNLFSLSKSKSQLVNFDALAADVGYLQTNKSLISKDLMRLPRSHFPIDNFANSNLAIQVKPVSHNFNCLSNIARAACNQSIMAGVIGPGVTSGYDWVLASKFAAMRRQSYHNSLHEQHTLMMANTQSQSLYTDCNSLPTMYNPSGNLFFPHKTFQTYTHDNNLNSLLLSNQTLMHGANGLRRNNNNFQDIKKKEPMAKAQAPKISDEQTSSKQNNITRSSQNAYAA